MLCCLRHPRPWLLGGALLALGVMAGLPAGCTQAKAPPQTPRYQALPAKAVPAFMQGTIFERVNLMNTQPFAVSGYGLVGRLRGTGDSRAPQAVREYMIREMYKHGFGQKNVPDFANQQPEDVLADPHYSLVRVDGFIPPGARANQRFDVQVSALETSATTSLAHGQLFEADLRVNGANDIRPGGAIAIWARCAGPLFVNPAYALSANVSKTQQRASLRYGVVMDGGMVSEDQPLALRVLEPQYSTTRLIEHRIDERFQDVADKMKKNGRLGLAAAQNEGVVYVYVPEAYRGDWEHFSQVVLHLYLNNLPEFAAMKAKQLADEAVKPNAPLQDISFCWEGLGTEALPHVLPLMSHPSPDVAFAAARAAAFIGDPSHSAQAALMQIARTPNHPFQLNAVQTLGTLPPTPLISQMLRQLLDSDQTLVRLEAYRILARSGVYSKVVREKFVLDIVPCAGPPMIYATRQGIPRLAILGPKPVLQTPLTFASLDNRLSLSAESAGANVTIFYRPETEASAHAGTVPPALTATSRPDLAEIIARLGGEGPPGEARFDLSYGDIVALVQAINEAHKLSAPAEGQDLPVAFVLQELPNIQDSIYNAPVIPDQTRPQDESPQVGKTE